MTIGDPLQGGTKTGIRVPFKFTIVHADDPDLTSGPHKAMTRDLTTSGLIFHARSMVMGGLHLSFTEASFSRNLMEISLELARRAKPIELLGQVEWYERRAGEDFIVGVSFLDLSGETFEILREFVYRSRHL